MISSDLSVLGWFCGVTQERTQKNAGSLASAPGLVLSCCQNPASDSRDQPQTSLAGESGLDEDRKVHLATRIDIYQNFLKEVLFMTETILRTLDVSIWSMKDSWHDMLIQCSWGHTFVIAHAPWPCIDWLHSTALVSASKLLTDEETDTRPAWAGITGSCSCT